MKYKQKDKKNQRIESITDQTLIVGADIAKKTHYALMRELLIFVGLNLENFASLRIIAKGY